MKNKNIFKKAFEGGVRSFFTRLAIIFLLFSGQVVLAEENISSPQVSKQDAAAVQKGVKELGKLFGVEAPEKKVEEPVKVEVENKTVADVMDKAIDKISDVVGVIAQTMSKVAPEIWEIMLRQQYAIAIMNLIVPLGLILVLSLYMIFVGYFWKPWKSEKKDTDTEDEKYKNKKKEEEEETARAIFVRIIPTIALCLTGLWFFNRLSDSISLLINPKYYAIKDLLRMIMNSGM